MASISRDRRNGLRRILFSDLNGDRKAVRLGKTAKKPAEAIKAKIEAILVAKMAGISLDKETAEWIGGLDRVLYDKMAAVGLVPKRAATVQATLGSFLQAYIDGRSDAKRSTVVAWGHTQRNLLDYFGTDKPLVDVTQGDAEAWRLNLFKMELAENTVRRRCGVARQFFRAALRRRLIGENPFGDMKGCAVRANRSRDYFLTPIDAQKILDACPDAEWRLIFALSRFGGLRCPSEHLNLRWGDVDWEQGRLTVHSPKTEHHQGKESRVLPIFPELRPHLETAFEQAAEGAEFIINRYRDPRQNLRTTFQKIIRRAGLKPWPKLFQNLRSTRETELAENFPTHVVCEWIGNSQAVAQKHYLQVTDEHFQQAATEPAGKAAQKAAQSAAEPYRTGSQPAKHLPVFSAECDTMRTCTNVPMGAEGLEPATPAL